MSPDAIGRVRCLQGHAMLPTRQTRHFDRGTAGDETPPLRIATGDKIVNRTARTIAVSAVLVSFATGFPHATRAENIQTHVTVDIRIALDRSVTETLHQEI